MYAHLLLQVTLPTRFKVLAEVCVSKIAPAGAGWWAANAFAADTLGFAGTDLGYFVTTGKNTKVPLS